MTTQLLAQLRAMLDRFGYLHLDRAQALALMNLIEDIGDINPQAYVPKFALADFAGTLPDAPDVEAI